MTKQEMFNRAWNGLKSQGFTQALNPGGSVCVYLSHDGKRCAWGWVDPEGTLNSRGESIAAPVGSLKIDGLGLAATLTDEDLRFATRLQRAHDSCDPHGEVAVEMQRKLQDLATEYSLTVPE